MKKRPKLYEVLHWASLFLEKNNCESKIAEILLCHHLNITKSKLYTMLQEPVASVTVQMFKNDITKHVETGIPVQYLMGYEYFYGRKFFVNSDVLIPRPETEELVHHAIKLVKEDERESLNIIDVGTGSGVIAITLALELPHVNVYGTDLSENALKIAEKNAHNHGLNIPFLQGDFLKPLIQQNIQADYIISNPPYIDETDKKFMSKTVKDFEPELALFAENKGLGAYEKIIQMTEKVSRYGTRIIFEIGYDQGKNVPELIKEKYPNSEVKVIQDINGKDRIVSAKLNLL